VRRSRAAVFVSPVLHGLAEMWPVGGGELRSAELLELRFFSPPRDGWIWCFCEKSNMDPPWLSSSVSG